MEYSPWSPSTRMIVSLPGFASAETAPLWSKATGTQIVGFSLATEIGHGPQC